MSNPRSGRTSEAPFLHPNQIQPRRRRHSNSPARNRYLEATTAHMTTPVGHFTKKKQPLIPTLPNTTNNPIKPTTASSLPKATSVENTNLTGGFILGGRGGLVQRTASYQQTPQQGYMVASEAKGLNKQDSRNPVPVYRSSSVERFYGNTIGNAAGDDERRDDNIKPSNRRDSSYNPRQEQRYDDPGEERTNAPLESDYGYIEYKTKRRSNSKSKHVAEIIGNF